MNNLKDIANAFAEEYSNDAIYPAHLFKAILHKSMGLIHFLERKNHPNQKECVSLPNKPWG